MAKRTCSPRRFKCGEWGHLAERGEQAGVGVERGDNQLACAPVVAARRGLGRRGGAGLVDWRRGRSRPEHVADPAGVSHWTTTRPWRTLWTTGQAGGGLMSTSRIGARAVGCRKVLVATSIGTLIEVYDILIYGYFATVLSQQFFPPGDPTAALLATFAIFAVGFFLRPLGAVIFGHLGDRFGRRTALAFSLLLMTLATVAFGLLPTYAAVGLLAPALLLLCRVLQGLSVSAELPGAMLLLLEHTPINRRGLAVSINTVGSGIGTVAAATVSLILARLLSPDQLAAWGWRVAFLIAAPIGIVDLYVRTRLLDSPAFLALGETARQGRAPLV